MSRLPRKVQEQVDAAEAALQGTTEVKEAPPVEEVVSESPAPEEVAEVVEETQPEEAASEEVDLDEAKWEERYKALQGKYNAEVPRLHQEVKDLKESVRDSGESESLRREIELLKAQLNQPVAQAPQTTAHIDKIRDDYGNELADAFAASHAENDALRQQVNDLLNRTNQIQTTSTLGTLSGMLAAQGIDFDQANNDPLFIDWLSHVDTFAGVPRQQMLNQAYEAGDLNRAAQFFVAYAGNQASPKTEPKPKASMEDHVKVRSQAAPKDNVPQEPVPWTQGQIQEFYRNKTAGMYSPEEAERLENQLFSALRA
jgi:hypothetical protein